MAIKNTSFFTILILGLLTLYACKEPLPGDLPVEPFYYWADPAWCSENGFSYDGTHCFIPPGHVLENGKCVVLDTSKGHYQMTWDENCPCPVNYISGRFVYHLELEGIHTDSTFFEHMGGWSSNYFRRQDAKGDTLVFQLFFDPFEPCEKKGFSTANTGIHIDDLGYQFRLVQSHPDTLRGHFFFVQADSLIPVHCPVMLHR